jgi:hypothetical protein
MTRRQFAGLLCAAAVAVLSAANLRAATIASWTFETSIPTTAGPLAPEVGSGSGTAFHATAGVTYSNPNGNGSAESWNSNTWSVGDYYQFQASTLGQNGITFSWDQTRSSAGPGAANVTSPNFRLQYSTDGTTFTDVTDYLVPIVTWASAVSDPTTKFSQNLSGVTALNNQANVYFRLTDILAPQNTGGQSRVDNVTISAVPEPAVATLAMMAAVIGLTGSRRRRS